MTHGQARNDRNAGRDPEEFSSDPLGDKIGDMLRQSYQDVVEEGIPDDFLDLLKKADAKAPKPAGGKS